MIRRPPRKLPDPRNSIPSELLIVERFNTHRFTVNWTPSSAKMPGEVIDRPNPRPFPSNIDDNVMSLAVKLDKTKLDDPTYTGLQEFRRAANYIAAGE